MHPKAAVKRTTMKVPVTFRDHVQAMAHGSGMDATVYLEKCRVVREVPYAEE